MSDSNSESPGEGDAPWLFSETPWGSIRLASAASGRAADDAMENICRLYWFPLYAYLRRKGYSVEDAEDLTQGFFAHFVRVHLVERADDSRGRFRTFLLSCLERYLVHEWRHASAQKRLPPGGFVSWDEEGAERRYGSLVAPDQSPEVTYDKCVAFGILETVFQRLKQEHARNLKAEFIDQVKEHVLPDGERLAYEATSQRLGMKVGQLRLIVFRLRQRFRELLYQEIGRLVSTPAEVEDEIRHLVSALRQA